MTKSKLYAGLITDSSKSPIELKFTNYSINNYQSDFSQGQKTVRTKILNSGIKGLNISQSITTKRKYFVQQFWFNTRSDFWTIGEFRPDVYGVHECKKDVNEMMDDHTNADGHWIKNPKITKKHKNERHTIVNSL